MYHEKKSQQIQKIINLRNKLLKTTHHKVLSSAIHDLLHLFLAVINPHMRFLIKLHQA
jgi:hypothetical protein